MTEPAPLLIAFTGAPAVERVKSSVRVVRASDLPLSPKGLKALRPVGTLTIALSRPSIGSPLLPWFVTWLRPERVVVVPPSGSEYSLSPALFVLRTLPGFVAAAIATATTIVVLPVLVAWLRNPVVRRRATATSPTVLYLRPTVGVGEEVGGAVTHTLEVIGALQSHGAEVVAITNDAAMVASAADIPSRRVRLAFTVVRRHWEALPVSYGFGADIALLAASRGVRPSFVYQRHTRFSLAGAIASRVYGVPLLLEYNAPTDFFRGDATRHARLRNLYDRVMLRAATRVVVVSEVARRQLVEGGVPAGRIVVIPNGVDPRRFGSGGEEARRELGLSATDVLIGFVASFASFHGAVVLAEAFARVAVRHPDVHLLLLGDGPERLPALRTLEGRGILDHVHAPGVVQNSRVPPLLDACDILVSPHVPLSGGVEFFGSPTKLYEYLAAGKAIVASRLGQIADVIDDEVDGLLVKAGDVEALADALSRLVAAPSERVALGGAARSKAMCHTWTRAAEAILQTYEGVASG